MQRRVIGVVIEKEVIFTEKYRCFVEVDSALDLQEKQGYIP